MNGLILGGGKSERMGRDKLLLTYHDVPQHDYIYKLLSVHCHDIYLNCRSALYYLLKTNAIFLPDLTENIGPAAAIEAAYNKKKTGSWMIIACDYPMINSNTLVELLELYHIHKSSIVFRNITNSHFEPCFGIYDETTMKEISNRISEPNFNLQSFFNEKKYPHLHLKNPKQLSSIDTQQEYNIFINEYRRKNY